MSASAVQVNEPVVRIVAFEVAVLAIIYAITTLYSSTPDFLAIPLFLLFDFYLRGWDLQRYSPLRWLAVQFNNRFLHKQKLIFGPPKFFAAKIGTIINFLIISAYICGYEKIGLTLTALLIVFALLESLAGFCAGCYLFSYYERMKHVFIKPHK